MIKVNEINMDKIRKSYIKNAIENNNITQLNEEDLEFLAKDCKQSIEFVKSVADEVLVKSI